MRLKKITKRWAKRNSACPGTRDRFFRLFPDGLDLSDEADVKEAWRENNNVSLTWFLQRIIDIPCLCEDHNGVPFKNDGRHVFAVANADWEDYTKLQLRSYAKKAGLPI